MTDAFRRMLESKLDDPDPVVRAHARFRLSVVDPEPAYPPFAVQAVSAVKAAARFVASGCETVDQSEFDRRKAICEACPNYQAADDRCLLCGCMLSIKPWSAVESCPDARW
ncbi:hypothetical protein [Paludisphaera rhizosphaerae]|uniref:hypothetical protein n=1 Tax=Paludisphaera rhizosphaerae TaxID=2711216 RepID=UPI0013EC8FBB|nr:hypothetical protein [Paludisphaera rhizosphaerae]